MNILLVFKIFLAWMFFVIATITLISEAKKHAKFMTRYNLDAIWFKINTSYTLLKLLLMSVSYTIWYIFLFT